MPRRTRASNPNVTLASSPYLLNTISTLKTSSCYAGSGKWAAFSQFFCTFSQLFAMNDVTVSDIERDLVHQTNTVISRIMQRLLYTLSYDRRVTLDNWQPTLRKQYSKRDPLANPIGPDPKDNKLQAKVEDEPLEVPKADSIDSTISEDRNKHLGEQNSTTRGSIPLSDAENPGLHSDAVSVHSIQSNSRKYSRGSDTGDIPEEETKEEAPIDWFESSNDRQARVTAYSG
ncbi:hypothetical protein CPB84DRAFT_1847438 [Gymnopilus junonius]|uniref:Uncharacterized protein n=1 Tax=Gymnopilus junonius TaxID=109634 RepID=A0A9P5TMP4_GYMJU|nr:hypothetical protein CPB84DRAFT_1847438 [Gymnopilus junonius]